MPKTRNIKKSAAALYQNQKQIKSVTSKTVFASVEKSLGRAQFQLKLTGGKLIVGTPRGLFTSGTLRISAGQVVIIEGVGRLEGDSRADLPWEIVARLDDTSEIKQLIKQKVMPADILSFATTAGAVETGAVAQDDLFEDAEAAEQGVTDVRGGVRAARKAEEANRAIAGRVASLTAGRQGGLDGGVVLGDAADLTLGAEEYERFKRWRAYKAKTVVAAPVAAVTVVAPSAAAVEAERIAELKQFFAERAVTDSWDEVDINDL
jgi:translation initiation factor IF-1